MNLSDSFALVDLQQIRSLTEVNRWPAPDAVIQANVELKLNPTERAMESGGIQFSILADVSLAGQVEMLNDASSEAVFVVELKTMAHYRQFSGEPIAFEQFCAHHASLARQLYPLLQSHLMGQLRAVGFGHVHLPMDLAHHPLMASDEQDSAVGQQTH